MLVMFSCGGSDTHPTNGKTAKPPVRGDDANIKKELERQLENIYEEIGRLETEIAQQKDPVKKAKLTKQIEKAETVITQIEAALDSLE